MKFGSVQIFRAIAANLVVLSHLHGIEAKYGRGYIVLPDWIGAAGPAGVHFFFVVSGFVMVFASLGASWWSFLLSRITRIYPPYWAYTTVIVLIVWTLPHYVSGDFRIPGLLLKSYLLWPDDGPPLLTVGWSLVFEMYFYMVWTLLMAFAVPVPLGLIGWAAATVALIAWGATGTPVMSIIASPLTFEFIAGAIVGLMVTKFPTPFRNWLLLVGLTGLALGFLYYLRLPANDTSLTSVISLAVPFSLILYCGVSWECSRAEPLRGLGWMVRLGDASYSTYLSHVLVLSALGRLFVHVPVRGWIVELVLVVTCVALANLVGLVSYSLLERPVLRLSRQFVRSRLPQEVTT